MKSKKQSIDEWKMKLFKKKLRYECKRKEPSKLLIELYSGRITYEDYLESDHWKGKRKEKVEAAKHMCEVCGEDEIMLVVHHKHYDNLGREKLGDLIALCPQCHKDVHKKIREMNGKSMERKLLAVALEWKHYKDRRN